MVLAAKQTLSAKIGFSNPLLSRNPSSPSLQRPPPSLSFPSTALPKRTVLSLSKPLHLSSLRAEFPLRCSAYEADKSEPQPIDAAPAEETKSEAAKKLKIGIYFATWWALNVVFNIYNKKVLNAYPYPWLTSTLSLAAGSLMMLISWAVGIVETPKTDFDFWKTLFPVAVAHTIGHVAATVSMSKVAVSFTHIIKSGEPAFSVLVSRFLLGETFPASVYLSLIPIIGGCALSALTELNFNMTGFMGAMISNLAFVFRNIFSKKGMKGKSVSGMNYYACLSMLSLLILTPFAFAVEGPQMWADGWQKALSDIGPQFVGWVAAQSVFYHLYNQVSYMSLDQISPLTFSVGNTMKRISVIVPSFSPSHIYTKKSSHRLTLQVSPSLRSSMAATMATSTKCMSLNPSPPKPLNQTKPISSSKHFITLPTPPKPTASLSVTSTALAGAVFSALSYSEPALAAHQISQLAAAAVSEGSDNRGLALLLPIVPAIGWVLFNILQPALNQINKMRASKGVVVGLGGIGGGLAASGLLTPPPEAVAAAEAAERAGDNRGQLLLFVVAPALLWVLYNILQPALNQLNKMRSQ